MTALPITPRLEASPTLAAADTDLRLTRAQVLASRPPTKGLPTMTDLTTLDHQLLADAIDDAYGWRTPLLASVLVVEEDGRIYAGALYVGRVLGTHVHLDRAGYARRVLFVSDVS